jgi:hypothetical protein
LDTKNNPEKIPRNLSISPHLENGCGKPILEKFKQITNLSAYKN